MTWSESNIMDKRLKSVARMLDGEKMATFYAESLVFRAKLVIKYGNAIKTLV